MKEGIRRQTRFAVIALALLFTGFGFQADRGRRGGRQRIGAEALMGWSSYSMQVYSARTASGSPPPSSSSSRTPCTRSCNRTATTTSTSTPAGTAAWTSTEADSEHDAIPNGLQDVIDYIHANGQKFGLYMIPGISPQAYNDDCRSTAPRSCTMQDIAVQPLHEGRLLGARLQDRFRPIRAPKATSIRSRTCSRSLGRRFREVRQRHPRLRAQRPVDRRPRRRGGMVAGAREAQDLARAVLGARPQLRRLLEEIRERLAGRLGRRVLLRRRRR